MERFQLKSMTAYGKGHSLCESGRFSVEIQSVNRRFLEVNLNLPRHLMPFEMEVRKRIAERIGRGMLHVSIIWKPEGGQSVTIIPNLPLARALREAWEPLALELGMEKDFPEALLAQEKDLFFHENSLVHDREGKEALFEALNQALEALLRMKREEGGELAKDLQARFQHLHQEIDHIEERSQEGVEKYRLKLQKRLDEHFSGLADHDERILREIALFAERVDTTEEIVRFKGHLEKCQQMIIHPSDHATETRGKTLDFLLQELLREINTLGAKSADLTTAQSVVAIKSELEKIREQVQNIE